MIALISAVLIASLLGSAHCAGMCGGLALLACAPGRSGPQTSASTLAACYHGGRLFTYALLGAAAGALGSIAEWGGTLVGFQRAAAIGAGTLLVAFALLRLAQACGLQIGNQARVPEPLRRFVVACHARAFTLPAARRAAVVGLLTPMLPCGWLYAFVAAAGGTGSAPLGAIAMSVFWLGTLPALLIAGAAATRLLGPLNRYAPFATSSVLLAVGIVTIFGKLVPHGDWLGSRGCQPESPMAASQPVSLGVPQGMSQGGTP